MKWNFWDKEQDDDPFGVKNLVKNIEEERATWRKAVDWYKEQLEISEKRRWELVNRQSNYEFILGDRETGWVWIEHWGNFPSIKIGQTIKLPAFNGESMDVIVDRFDSTSVYSNESPLRITFYVTEPFNPKQ